MDVIGLKFDQQQVAVLLGHNRICFVAAKRQINRSSLTKNNLSTRS